MPTRRPADAENPPLTDGFGRSIFPEILSARNTGSLAIWFRHHCFVERGARELPLSPHSGNHRQLTTPHGRMQALCKARAKLPPPPPQHFHRRSAAKRGRCQCTARTYFVPRGSLLHVLAEVHQDRCDLLAGGAALRVEVDLAVRRLGTVDEAERDRVPSCSPARRPGTCSDRRASTCAPS